MVRDTSINSYIELDNEGVLEAREEEIYELLRKSPNMTDNEITEALGYKHHNEISPARWRLVEKQLLMANGKRKCSIKHRTVYQWRLNILKI